MARLKACPFCGGKAKVIHDYDKEEFAVCCTNSKCLLHSLGIEYMPRVFDTKEEAVSIWNFRKG